MERNIQPYTQDQAPQDPKPLELPEPRLLWGPGISKTLGAKRYLNSLVLGVCEELDVRNLLQIGSGIGETLIYLAESREARYSGITSRQDWVTQGSHRVLKRNMQQTIRFFAAQPVDPRSYRPFPDQDLIIALDVLPAFGSDIISAGGKALRPGGRFFLSGLFRTGETPQNYPDLKTTLEVAQESELVFLDQVDASTAIKVGFGQKILGGIKSRKNPHDTLVQVAREAALVQKGLLEYKIIQWVKETGGAS